MAVATGLILGGAGLLTSGIGTGFSFAASSDAADDARDQAKINAQLIMMQTRDEVFDRMRRGRLLRGAQKTAFAGAGVRVGAGSATNILFDTLQQENEAIRRIRARAALLIEAQFSEGSAAANALNAQGTASLISGAGSIFAGGSNLAFASQGK